MQKYLNYFLVYLLPNHVQWLDVVLDINLGGGLDVLLIFFDITSSCTVALSPKTQAYILIQK